MTPTTTQNDADKTSPDSKMPEPEQMFMFRVILDEKKEVLLSFVHDKHWDRTVVIHQLARLYSDTKSFILYDGELEVRWNNTPEDIALIISKLNNPQDHVVSTTIQEDDNNTEKTD